MARPKLGYANAVVPVLRPSEPLELAKVLGDLAEDVPSPGMHGEDEVTEESLKDQAPVVTGTRRPKYQPPVKSRRSIDLPQHLWDGVRDFSLRIETELGIKTTDAFHFGLALCVYDVIRLRLPHLIDDLYACLDGTETSAEAQVKLQKEILMQVSKLHTHR